MTATNDATSVAPETARDADWFERCVANYHLLIFALCYRMIGHRQDAEDLTQETFSRLYQHRFRFDPERPVEPYLKSIAGNRCRTFLANRCRQPAVCDADQWQDDQAARDREASQLHEEVIHAVQSLPVRHRMAFEKFHLEHRTYEQIADEMGCPIGTAKTWVHRARAALMTELSRREVAGGPNE